MVVTDCDEINYKVSVGHVLIKKLFTVFISNNSLKVIVKNWYKTFSFRTNKYMECIQVDRWHFYKIWVLKWGIWRPENWNFFLKQGNHGVFMSCFICMHGNTHNFNSMLVKNKVLLGNTNFYILAQKLKNVWVWNVLVWNYLSNWLINCFSTIWECWIWS